MMRVLLLSLFVAAVSCQHHPGGHHVHGHAQRTNVTCTSLADCDSVTCMDGLVKSCPANMNHHLAQNHLFHCVCHLRLSHNKRAAVGSHCTTEQQCRDHGQGHCQHSHGHNNHMHCDLNTQKCYCDTKSMHCTTDADCTCHHAGQHAFCNKAPVNPQHPDGHCGCRHN